MKEVNLHKGHRVRLKNQFLKNGLSSFEEHQILELLLFYAIPQCDTNVYAHNLINRFGSLSGVFSAEYEDLKTVPGIGDNAATLLKLIPQLCVMINARKRIGTLFETTDVLADFFKTQFLGVSKEQIKLACLDDDLRLIDVILLATGDIGAVSFDARKAFQEILRTNCSQIVIAHNHPAGLCKPSSNDIMTTSTVQNMIKPMNVTLLEHVIVGTDGVYLIMADEIYPFE